MHVRRASALVGSLGALALGAACARGPILSSVPVDPARTEPIAGVGYYLPKTLVRVDLYVGSELRRRPRTGPDGKPIWNEEKTGARQAVETRLETTYFGVFAGERTVPDLRHHFVIDPRFDMSSSDLLDVGVGPDGLLSYVRGVAKDETHDIATGLASLVSLLVTAPARFDSGTSRAFDASTDLDQLDLKPRLVSSLEFDPTDPADLARVRGALGRHAVTLSIVRQSDCPVAASGAGCCTTCSEEKPGVYYRLPVPYRMQLSPGGTARMLFAGAQQQETEEVRGLEGPMDRTVLLPNEAICKYVPVTRATFVTKQTDLKFDRGMLVQATTNKPSELLGFVKIPVDVATTIVGIPAELLKIRIEENSRHQQLIKGQTDVATQEVERLKAMTEAMKAGAAFREAGGK
jgi:hypothetical protein